MLGFGKWFVIFIFISFAVWYGTKNIAFASQIMLTFIVIKIVWMFFTGKKEGT